MNSSTDENSTSSVRHKCLFSSTCNVGDRILSPCLIESRHGVIMPRELVTITKVTDYIVEVISDNFVPMKFARM